MSTEITKAETTGITAMQMINNAVMGGADIDQVQKLMELHERIEAREAEKAFIVAMAEFKKNAPTLTKSRHVNYEYNNTVTDYYHADLYDITAAVCPIMSEAGLTHTWKTEQNENSKIRVTCIITHVLGHSEENWLEASPDTGAGKNGVQAIGSTNTYLERYTLLAALGMATKHQDNDAINLDYITEEQRQNLQDRLENTNSDIKAFCKAVAAPSLAEIKSRDFGNADNLLKSKEKKQ